MTTILDSIAQAPSLPLLWRQMARFYDCCGFGGMSYYWMKPGTNMPATAPLRYGFSQTEVDLYLSLDFQTLDIAPRAALAAGFPLRWSQIWRNRELTSQEREFVETLRTVSFSDGYSLPCYGSGNRNGVVALGKMKEDVDLSPIQLTKLHFIAEAAHLRVCRMFTDEEGHERQLSSREKEILHWVARGKSNTVIATILDISSGTVDTYMRRIYQKLEVSDRTSAAVKGVGLGLVGV
jgi:DNA-binding CsgD family transcriptional regulator